MPTKQRFSQLFDIYVSKTPIEKVNNFKYLESLLEKTENNIKSKGIYQDWPGHCCLYIVQLVLVGVSKYLNENHDLDLLGTGVTCLVTWRWLFTVDQTVNAINKEFDLPILWWYRPNSNWSSLHPFHRDTNSYRMDLLL